MRLSRDDAMMALFDHPGDVSGAIESIQKSQIIVSVECVSVELEKDDRVRFITNKKYLSRNNEKVKVSKFSRGSSNVGHRRAGGLSACLRRM
jgi:hypothetical protein